MRGERISFWIPRKFRWIRQAIRSIRKNGAEEGIPLSEADVVLAALVPFLEGYKNEEIDEDVKSESSGGRQRTIICRKKDDWLFECLDRLVEAKKAMGIRSSFSYELIRLAKNGFLKSMEGHKLDRSILREKDDFMPDEGKS